MSARVPAPFPRAADCRPYGIGRGRSGVAGGTQNRVGELNSDRSYEIGVTEADRNYEIGDRSECIPPQAE